MDLSTAAQIADDVMSSTREIASVPGIAYGVVRGNELVHVGGRGVAYEGGPVPDGDTVFRIASMSKSFTAATVLALRDEGRVRLDDPVTDYYAPARTIGAPDGPVITLRDLLSMGAGLATDDPWGDRQESLPPNEFDALVSAGLSFCRPPRMAFEYSNTNYAMLGRVIENVTGMRYQDVVTERICRPLGMTSSGFDPRDVPSDRRAVGYRISSDGDRVPEPLVTPGAYSAMGGLLSSVRDLSMWVAGFLGSWSTEPLSHPVDRWSLREAQEMARYVATEMTTGPAEGMVTHGYGFGLMVEEHQVLGRIVAHSGGYPGFGSHMRWHPGSGWGVIALGNATYAPMRIAATTLLARLVLESDTAHAAKPPIAPVPWPQTVAAVDVAEELLRGSDALVNEANWSPNMDLDIPRAERLLTLAAVRDCIGHPVRISDSLEFPTPAQAIWTVTGDAGSAKLDLIMTPERTPRIQKITVTRVKDELASAEAGSTGS